MVQRRADGWSVPAIAEAAGISTRRVHVWLKRHREEGAAGLENRSSVAHQRPHALREPWAAMIARLRRLRLTALEIAERLRIARSTVSAVLARLGLGRLDRLEPPAPIRRYERERPGEMIHLDTKKLGRFSRAGHRVTGQRKGQSNTRGVGWEVVHVAIDDFSRAAYVEVLDDEKKRTCTAFLLRALRWFKARGVAVERVMTDNGSAYKSRFFAKALRRLSIHHIRTRPYTPRTNGKAERFIQTLMREWAYALPYPNSQARSADLPRWLAYYNQLRPHGSLHYQAPICRLPRQT